MTKYDLLDSLVQKNNGYLLTSAVQEAGISRTYLSRYVKDNDLERVEPGVYITPETWPDSFYILQIKNKEVVFSHETALYLHGLMEREPFKTSVSVKRGYNATHLIKKGVKPYYVNSEVFDKGVTTVETNFGNTVRAYDIDRTICDIVKRKDEMDVQVFQYGIIEYMRGKDKNVSRLMKYADLLGTDEKVREYTEVLL